MEKTAFITGATAGIGYALAKELSERGWKLLLLGRSPERLEKISKEFENAKTITFDLSSDNFDELFEILAGEDIDVFVNNAGFGSFGPFHTLDLKGEVDMVKVNVIAPLIITHFAIRYFLERRKKGIIVNVSSIAGFFPTPFMATYGATKAFLNSFSEAVRREVEDLGIRVITICPGATKTEFQKKAGVNERIYDFQRYMTAEEVAQKIVKAIESGKSPVVIGGNKPALVLAKFLPLNLVTKIAKVFMKARVQKNMEQETT